MADDSDDHFFRADKVCPEDGGNDVNNSSNGPPESAGRAKGH